MTATRTLAALIALRDAIEGLELADSDIVEASSLGGLQIRHAAFVARFSGQTVHRAECGHLSIILDQGIRCVTIPPAARVEAGEVVL